MTDAGPAAGSANDDPVEGFAAALFAAAQAQGALDRVEDELYTLARAADANPELRDRLDDPGLPIDRKLGLVEELLRGKAHPQTLSSALFIVASGRARQLGAIATALSQRAAASRSSSLAEVRSAVPLDDVQRQRLSDAVARTVGRPVALKVVVDPKVLGGIVVTVGDTVIDGSVSRRLAELRSALAGA